MGRRANPASIRAFREAVGIRISDLARDVEISVAYACNIEAGRKEPSPAVVRRIADRLGVKLDAITYPVPDADDKAIA